MMKDVMIDPIERAIEAFQRGEMVVLLDAPDREGEADLILPGQYATGEKLNTIASIARGLITMGVSQQRLQELQIPLIEPVNCKENYPRFTEPVDYTIGTTTGASAFDLAATAKAVTDPDARPEQFARPGHLLLLAEHPDGLQSRAGHTEGSVGLARAARLFPAAVICEMFAPDGTMATGNSLKYIVNENKFPVATVQQVKDILKSH
ncbi:MAG: 3,4-dihydroxy-2-butanone-4-phosphate synthase [Armatimonadota bacterium]